MFNNVLSGRCWKRLAAGVMRRDRERQMTQRGGAQFYLIGSEIARRYVCYIQSINYSANFNSF